MITKRLFERFSASQLSLFTECERKWYNTYILGLKQPSTVAQLFGTTLHSVAEHYLRFGEVSLAQVHVPDGVDGDKVLKVFKAGIPHLPEPPIADVETEITVQADVPGIGYIDALYRDDNQLVILDHKTAKNTRYIPSPDDLKDNIQLNVYGHWASEKYGDDTFKFQHIYYVHGLKKPKSVEVSVEVSANDIAVKWNKYTNTVSEMLTVSKLDEKKVPQNWSACTNYGGCPFVGKCHLTPYMEINVSKDRLIDTLLNPTTEKPKPIETPTRLAPVAINPPASEVKAPKPDERNILEPPTTPEPKRVRTLYIKCYPSKGSGVSPIHYPDLIAPHVQSLCKQYDVPHVSLIGQYGDGYKKLAAMVAHIGWPDEHDAIYINPIRSKGSELILDALICAADKVIEGV